MLARAEDFRLTKSKIIELAKANGMNSVFSDLVKKDMNDTLYDQLPCNLCNIAGTELCNVHGQCVCKAWYEGEHCQQCRPDIEFVLAPNGTCVPCQCDDRSTTECLQNGLCSTHSSLSSSRQATAASAIFMATLCTIVIVSVYLLYRIMKRTKHLRSMARRNYIHDDCQDVERDAGTDQKDDEDLLEEGYNSFQMTPLSNTSSTPFTSLFHIRSSRIGNAAFRGRRSISAFFNRNLPKLRRTDYRRSPIHTNTASTPSLLNVENVEDEWEYPKGGMRISSSCFEYYFLSVRNSGDDGDGTEEG